MAIILFFLPFPETALFLTLTDETVTRLGLKKGLLTKEGGGGEGQDIKHDAVRKPGNFTGCCLWEPQGKPGEELCKYCSGCNCFVDSM